MIEQLERAKDAPRQRVETALQEILENEVYERRTDPRIPYFGPVTVRAKGAAKSVSAFCRDLSVGGIGLVQLQPLEKGETVIEMPLPSGKTAALRTEILWCRNFGNGWYASGGRLLDTAE